MIKKYSIIFMMVSLLTTVPTKANNLFSDDPCWTMCDQAPISYSKMQGCYQDCSSLSLSVLYGAMAGALGVTALGLLILPRNISVRRLSLLMGTFAGAILYAIYAQAYFRTTYKV